MRLKELRLLKGYKAKEIGALVGLDEAAWSKIEKYHFLPTPATLNKICDVLQVSPLDIYERDEITLASQARPKKNSGATAGRGYNLCVMVPEEYREKLKTWIDKLGYRSFTSFIIDFLKATEEKFNAGHQ